jgi:threonine synthase
MAQMLTTISGDKPVTILTATSGDTGAAVAHAFYGLKNVRVVILYPNGKISPLQEKLFCTLGGNIETVAIDADFDACQALVKQAFDDEELKVALGLNSANSINISRLLAQICYYFEAVAQLPQEARNQLVVSVPSGNFGDLTAGLLAKSLGCPLSVLSRRPMQMTPCRASCRTVSGSQKRHRQPCRTRWTSASRTTGRAWKSCSAVKSGA